MQKWLAMGAWAILATLANAEDFKLANGKTITGDLSRVEPDGLVLMTEAGIEKISFLLLPEETQKRFGFDFRKSEAFRAQQSAARKQELEQQAAAIRSRVARVEMLQKNQWSLEDQQRRVQIESAAIQATALVLQGTSKGARVKLSVKTGRAATTMLDHDTRATVDLGEGFVHGLRAADGDIWEGKLFPAGLYIYSSASGGERTVHAYALTADEALAKSAPKAD